MELLQKTSHIQGLRHPDNLNLARFDMTSFDAGKEYFAIAQEESGEYTVYSIGNSKTIAAYSKGYKSLDDAMMFINQLPARIFYFREHPATLVQIDELLAIVEKHSDSNFIESASM